MDLLQQQYFLLNAAPVATLTGDEFARKEGVTLTQQVADYYAVIGNKATSPTYGEVILDKKGVDDDFAHGVNRTKAVAFAAVPQIIEKGIVILPFGKYKEGEKIVSAMIAAPISIAQKDYIGVVVIRQNKVGDNRLYVHEVTIKEKLLEKFQGVGLSLNGSSNPALQKKSAQATSKGAIAKVLQKIMSAKHFEQKNMSSDPDWQK